MRLKKICLLFFFTIPSFSFCGCFDHQIFENTAIIIYAAAESSDEEGQLLFTVAAAESEGKDGSLLILSEKDELMESAVSTLNSESPHPLRSGKIQNILFSSLRIIKPSAEPVENFRKSLVSFTC